MLAQLCLIAMIVVTLAGAICDIRALTIPNIVPALIAALFVPYAVFLRMAPSEVLIAVAIALAVLAAGFGAFAAGLAGGGDAKLLAAVSLWAGPNHVAALLLATAFAGAVLALFLVIPPLAQVMRAARHGTPAADAPPGAMPYGVAITVGTLLLACGRPG